MLRAVAEHRDRFTGQRLPHEVRNHHPVLARLPGSDGVEEAHDDHRELALLPVGEREKLVDRLAAGVGPAVLRRWSQDQIGVFTERHVLALAVDLGGRGDDDQLFLLVRVLQHDLGAVHVGLDGVDRLLDDQFDADRGGEMEHHVAAIDQLRQQRLVGHRVDEVFEPGPPFQMGDVVDRSGGQVVQDLHLVALIEQRFGEMGPDESGPASDQRSHSVSFPSGNDGPRLEGTYRRGNLVHLIVPQRRVEG